MKTIEEGRSWLKADEWDMEIETDQQKGVPHPPLQKPVPEGTVLIELIPPERISLGDVPLRGSAGSSLHSWCFGARQGEGSDQMGRWRSYVPPVIISTSSAMFTA